MQPFTTELLTILVLVSISLAGLTFLVVVIFIIIYISSFCARRRRLTTIKPIPTNSSGSTISINHHSPAISPGPIRTPIRNIDQHKKFDQHYDEHSIIDEHSYLNHKNKYQQQEYMRDKNNETTTTMNESRMYIQRPQKRQYQSVKPMTDMRILDRHTPYPPDVIARERLMNNTRLPMDEKY